MFFAEINFKSIVGSFLFVCSFPIVLNAELITGKPHIKEATDFPAHPPETERP